MWVAYDFPRTMNTNAGFWGAKSLFPVCNFYSIGYEKNWQNVYCTGASIDLVASIEIPV